LLQAAEQIKSESENESYEIEAKHSYSVLRNSFPFSITAIIYVIVFSPVIAEQFYVIFNGPIVDKPYWEFILTFWFLFAGNCTTLMNLLFYGVLSKVLRQEVMNKLRSKVSEVTVKVQRIRSVSEVTSNRHAHSVNEDRREGGGDCGTTIVSTPSDLVGFFDDD